MADLDVSSTKTGYTFYTIKLLRRGVDVAGGMEQDILRTMKVKEFMRNYIPMLQEVGKRHLIVAGNLATGHPATIGPNDNIRSALHIMSKRGISQLPVVMSDNGKKVIGTLREKDVLAAYDKAVIGHEIGAL